MNPQEDTPRHREEELSSEQVSDLKVRINELIWQYGPETLSLREADILAGNIMWSIQRGELPHED